MESLCRFVVCLMLTCCASFSFAVLACEEYGSDDCHSVSELIGVNDLTNLPEVPSVEETEIKVVRFNPSLQSTQEVSLIVPEWTDATQEDQKLQTTLLPEPESTSDTDTEKVWHNLVAEVKKNYKKIQKLEAFRERLVDKLDRLEVEAKINNLVFTNIRESRNEDPRSTLQTVLNIINHVMKVKTKAEDISMALRVSSKSSAEFRPIVVTFTNYLMKVKVLAARHRLAVINKQRNTNIDVSIDYSAMATQRRKELLPFLLEKRAQGHYAYLVYDKLVVDGLKVSLKDLKAQKKEKEELHTSVIRYLKERSEEVDKEYHDMKEVEDL